MTDRDLTPAEARALTTEEYQRAEQEWRRQIARANAACAAAEEKLAEAEKHADALAEHMQSLQDAGYEFHAPDNCERVDALLAAHAARRQEEAR